MNTEAEQTEGFADQAAGDCAPALHALQSRHRALLDAIDEGYCIVEVIFDDGGRPIDYRFLEINSSFEQLTGIPRAVGRLMREIAPAHEQYWFDVYGRVALTGEPIHFESHAASLGGRWYDVRAYRVDPPAQHHVAILFSDNTERRRVALERAEAVAREREANALVDSLSDSAPIGLAFVDRDLRFRRVNASLARMNGIPAADHIGKRPDEVLHGIADLPTILRRWTEIIATGEPWLGVEVSGETPAQPGVQRTWTENFFPVRVEGKVLGLGAVVEETTERKKAEQALAASEARFRRLIELGPVGIALSEADGRVVLANNAFLQMLGYAPEEADKVNWLEQTAPEHVALSHEHIARLRRGERPVPYEKDYVRRDGTRVTALVVAQFMPGEGDRMMAFAIDISYRKAADRALRESEARLRHLIDYMAGFVAMLDSAGTVLEVGEPALRVAGFRREEVIGRKFWEGPWWAHDPDLQRRMEAGVREALEGKTIREDIVACTKEGGEFAIDLMLAPVFAADGRVTHVIPSGLDVSARKRIELALRENEERLSQTAAALQDADRRKDEFLATLAHELRNPLAPIRNGVQILRLTAASNPVLQRTTEMMERQMQHLVRLVDDLLDVSRITRGKIELRHEPVLLNEVVSSALDSCETLFEPHGHELRVQIAPEPLIVLGDPDRLRQIFSNLLSNAAKFTPREGVVWVSLERSDDHALVRVRDTGIGIPADQLQSVFDMFAQAHAAHVNDGLGIGLALVKQLVRLHGGTVEVESKGVGRGSQFTVRLPIAHAASPHVPGEAARSGGSATEPATRRVRNILVVDDNADAAESLARVLTLLGQKVRTCAGGVQAVSAAAADPPDLIFMDIGMPDMDGLTAARRIRELPGCEEVRIVALTGWGQDTDRQRSRRAGIDEHLVKPVSPETLLKLL